MKKKKLAHWPGFQIGTSYLLVIFIILCLVTFAALSLSSALKDQSYAEKSANHQTAYASACSDASARLADIDQALLSSQPYEALQQIDGISVNTQEDGWMITWNVPVTETQHLEIAVLADPSDGSRRIISWKETASSQWTEQTTLPVLGSDSAN